MINAMHVLLLLIDVVEIICVYIYRISRTSINSRSRSLFSTSILLILQDLGDLHNNIIVITTQLLAHWQTWSLSTVIDYFHNDNHNNHKCAYRLINVYTYINFCVSFPWSLAINSISKWSPYQIYNLAYKALQTKGSYQEWSSWYHYLNQL